MQNDKIVAELKPIFKKKNTQRREQNNNNNNKKVTRDGQGSS